MFLFFDQFFELFDIFLLHFRVVPKRIGQDNLVNFQILSLLHLFLVQTLLSVLNKFDDILFCNFEWQSSQNDGIVTRTVDNLIALLLKFSSFKSKIVKEDNRYNDEQEREITLNREIENARTFIDQGEDVEDIGQTFAEDFAISRGYVRVY